MRLPDDTPSTLKYQLGITSWHGNLDADRDEVEEKASLAGPWPWLRFLATPPPATVNVATACVIYVSARHWRLSLLCAAPDSTVDSRFTIVAGSYLARVGEGYIGVHRFRALTLM